MEKRKRAAHNVSHGENSCSSAVQPPAKRVEAKTGGREIEETDVESVGQEARAASQHIRLPTVYPELHGMANVPSTSAKLNPDAQPDMEYHDWNPCEVYPETEQSFDLNEESFEMLPGVTDTGERCMITQGPPNVGSMSDHVIEISMSLPVRGARGRCSSRNITRAGDMEAGEEGEEGPLARFWRPNRLY
jgi:hypothetical protein